MESAVKEKNSPLKAPVAEAFDPADWIPPEIGEITDHQTDLPRIAKDPKAIAAIEARLSQVPTTHDLYNHDSRQIDFLPPHRSEENTPELHSHSKHQYPLFFNDTATTEIYTLSLHDALPIYRGPAFPGSHDARSVQP